MGNKKIEIILRQCFYSPCIEQPNRYRPGWFSKQKIFFNLLYTTNFEVANLNIIYDKHFGPKEDTLLKRWETIDIDCGTEMESFIETINIVEKMKLDDDTIVYFLEDDYLHKDNWCKVLLEGFETPANFVTLYDHPDKYGEGYEDLKSHIYLTESCHWRTIPSTTNTFATRYKTLMDNKQHHIDWSTDIPTGITNDSGRWEVLEREGNVLVSSIPGYSTHVNDQMSPLVNWQNE